MKTMEFRCPYCEVFQGSPYNLREHISSDHQDKPYPRWLMTQREFMKLEEKKSEESVCS
jgi:hypothetical protein